MKAFLFKNYRIQKYIFKKWLRDVIEANPRLNKTLTEINYATMISNRFVQLGLFLF